MCIRNSIIQEKPLLAPTLFLWKPSSGFCSVGGKSTELSYTSCCTCVDVEDITSRISTFVLNRPLKFPFVPLWSQHHCPSRGAVLAALLLDRHPRHHLFCTRHSLLRACWLHILFSDLHKSERRGWRLLINCHDSSCSCNNFHHW